MTLQEHKELLMKPVWNYKDVMLYCDCKKSKAFQIMAICKEKLGGKVLFNNHGITRDSCLTYMGTSIEHERYIIKQLETT